jgi:osmotically-inducible protein OsmY
MGRLVSDVMRADVVALRLAGIISRADVLGVYDRPDAEIRDEIMTQVIGEDFLSGSMAFAVTVTGGVVTLRGPVENEAVGLTLLAAVGHVDGVVAVREELSLPALERRSHRV